jgi:hypothetical protein
MKKIIIALNALILITNFSIAQNLKNLDNKNGFRDLTFGTKIDSISDLKLVGSSGYDNFYKKVDEKLKIGEYDIESITYVFYKNKFRAVMIKSKGYVNSRGILNFLSEQYGKGSKNNQYIEEYWWFGKTISLHYDENSITNDSKIYMDTNIFDKERELDKKESQEKAKSDF